MSITRRTHTYIREHPSVADCLDRGLINYSSLAREICEQVGVDAFDAVLAACRRYHAKGRTRRSHEGKISSLVKGAKVRVRNKITVAIVEKGVRLEKALEFQRAVRNKRGDLNFIEGEEVFIVVTNTEFIPLIKDTFGARLKKITSELAQITMVIDPSLETVSGVVSYIYRLFAESDINIREEMSCWTDVMVVIDEKDVAKAMQVLG